MFFSKQDSEDHINEQSKTSKDTALDLAHHVEYANESVVSKTLL